LSSLLDAMKLTLYIIVLPVKAFIYGIVPFLALYHQRLFIKMTRNASKYRYNVSPDGGCSPTPSPSIRVYEHKRTESTGAWAFELNGPTANMSLQYWEGRGWKCGAWGRNALRRWLGFGPGGGMYAKVLQKGGVAVQIKHHNCRRRAFFTWVAR